MAKAVRRFPVAGLEQVLTSAGLIEFLNGEADLTEEQAAALAANPISDIRVKQDKAEDSEASAKAAEAIKQAEAEALREAEEAQKRADEEKARIEAEEAEKARLAAEEAQKQAEEEAARLKAESEAKAAAEVSSAPKAPASGKKVPPALK
jgi:septal ring factor EnvC (AmiA/AmiB activator)